MSNVCSCPKPPGGQVTCSDNQLAVCGYRNGQIVSGCYDQPASARLLKDESERSLTVANWALSVIIGMSRDAHEGIDPDLLAMLGSGTYKHETTGEIIRFALPRDLELRGVPVVVPLARGQ